MKAIILVYNHPSIIIDASELAAIDALENLIKVKLHDGQTIVGYYIKFEMVY